MKIRIDIRYGAAEGADRCYDLSKVIWPRAVPVARAPIHLPLDRPSGAVELQMFEHRVGTAFRVRLSRRRKRVTYWTRHKGRWSFDCRRVDRELTLIGFIEPNHPGFPVDLQRRSK